MNKVELLQALRTYQTEAQAKFKRDIIGLVIEILVEDIEHEK
jgi:hypothetical protein